MFKFIETYNHSGRVGVLVEFSCKTDFSTKTDEFKEFAKDIAMHIAGCNPVGASSPSSAEIISIQTREKSKIDKDSGAYLMNQGFIKDPHNTVLDVLSELNHLLSEVFEYSGLRDTNKKKHNKALKIAHFVGWDLRGVIR